MSPRAIERWAISVLTARATGARPEDSLIEFKRELPSPEKAARRIAGLCNAARGEDVLWIVGVDEQRGAVGLTSFDLSIWLPSVLTYFDGIPPSITDVVIPFGGVSLLALAFHSLRPPYVVRNPGFGSVQGVVAEREVPWREGTRTRSACRDELLSILIEVDRFPDVEILEAHCSLVGRNPNRPDETVSAYVGLDVYIMPRSSAPLVLPLHRCKGLATSPSDGEVRKLEITSHSARESRPQAGDRFHLSMLRRQPQVVVKNEPDSPATVSAAEVVIYQSARISIHGHVDLPIQVWTETQKLSCELSYQLGISRLPLCLKFEAVRKERTG